MRYTQTQPKEGDVRYIDVSSQNYVRLTGYVMSCTKLIDKEGQTPIVGLQLSIRGDKRDDAFNFITLIGQKAELALNKLAIGDQITVICEISSDKYTNKDGRDAYATNLVVKQISFAENAAAKEFRIWKKQQAYAKRGQVYNGPETIVDNYMRKHMN